MFVSFGNKKTVDLLCVDLFILHLQARVANSSFINLSSIKVDEVCGNNGKLKREVNFNDYPCEMDNRI